MNIIIIIATVLLGLFLLYIAIKGIKRKIKDCRSDAVATVRDEGRQGKESGEVFAVIALALYSMEEEMHDEENTVLTIRRVVRPYSPWSSKIYGLREIPRK